MAALWILEKTKIKCFLTLCSATNIAIITSVNKQYTAPYTTKRIKNLKLDSEMTPPTLNRREEMIHFANTATGFTAVVGPIRLPVETRRAPNGSPVALTSKNISGAEILQAWYHDVMAGRSVSSKRIRRMIVPIQVSYGLFLPVLYSPWDDSTLRSPFVLLFGMPLWTSRNETRGCKHCEKKTEISDSEQEEKDAIDN
ncbi:MAG: hypothetical protein Q9167_002749 [Letrouitia subvulpina]